MGKKSKDREIEVAVAEVVDYLRINGQFAPALKEVVTRKITADAAKKSKLKVTSKELQDCADAFRVAAGLFNADDTNTWLQENGISVEALEQYLETNILVSKYKDQLHQKADKESYLSSEAVEEEIREMVYSDWVRENL